MPASSNKVKTKILFFIDSLGRGGAETLLLTICKGLIKTNINFEIKVLLFRGEHDLRNDFLELNIPVVTLDLAQYPFLYRFWVVYKEIKRFKPDILHSHLLFSDRYGPISAFFAGVKYRFSTVHNMELQRSFQDKITRILTSFFAKKIITVSESVRLFCIKEKMYPAAKMKTIYNGTNFNPDNFEPKYHKHLHTPIQLVTVGRLTEQKAQHIIIDAVTILKTICDLKFELHIYGIGVLQQFLEEKIKLSNANTIYLHGLIDNSQIPSVLQSSDIYVSASLWEGLPISTLEAMCIGLPLILSNITPHCELIDNTNSKYKFLFECNNSEELAQKIVLAATNPELYNNASKLCHTQSFQFTEEIMLEKYVKLYSI